MAVLKSVTYVIENQINKLKYHFKLDLFVGLCLNKTIDNTILILLTEHEIQGVHDDSRLLRCEISIKVKSFFHPSPTKPKNVLIDAHVPRVRVVLRRVLIFRAPWYCRTN